MSLGNKINEIRKQKNLSIDELCERSGIPKGTLSKITAGITTSPTLDTVRAIASALECRLDDLDDNPNKKDYLSVKEQDHIKKYRLLDPYGKEAVDGVLDVEWRRVLEKLDANQGKKQAEVVTLPQPYAQVAAAEGAGAFLMDSEYEEIALELNDYTQKADVILKVVGRSMEPEIHDGDRILVREQPSVNVGEIGVFILDGQGYLKIWASDRLVSLNPEIRDVYPGDLQQVECFGKFIKVLDPDWIR